MTSQILFISANPSETTKLKVAEECNIIDSELRGSEYGRQFKLEQRHAVSLSDLSEYLQRFRPNIVHFSGHGSDEGELVFQNYEGTTENANPVALANLFRILNDSIQEDEKIKCVILNACYSDKEQARAIAKHVDCVIGISDEIKDESAIKFAAHFYQALGYGHSVKKAFELGCVQLGLEEDPDENIIKLEHRDNVDPAKVFLANKQEKLVEATKRTKTRLPISIAAGASVLAIFVILIILPGMSQNGLTDQPRDEVEPEPKGLPDNDRSTLFAGFPEAEGAAPEGSALTLEGKAVPAKNTIVQSFQAKPASINVGDSSEISWNATGENLASVVISPDIGPVLPTGTWVVWPTRTAVYSIVANDRSGDDYKANLQIVVADTEIASNGNETLTSSGPDSIETFPVSPGNGTVFDHYPRTTTLEWEDVGASSYALEIQYCYDGHCVPYLAAAKLKDSSYTFDFAGAQEGRWRVWTVDGGYQGPKTNWSTFSYSK
jgi:hypothetical protein